MQITVTEVGPVYKDGKYEKFDLFFIRDGKPSKRTIVDFNKEIFGKLKDAKKDEGYEIELKQDPKTDFWNWVGVKAIGTDYPVPETASAPRKASAAYQKVTNTYETPEERKLRRNFEAKKHADIGRIAAINSAIALLGPKAKLESVLSHADAFVQYVNGKQAQVPVDLVEVSDDIPF